MVIVLMGAPGVGKGTQAALLVKAYNLKHLSTGDMLREEVQKGTPVGSKVKAIIDKGDLVNDMLMTEVIEAQIGDGSAEGYIFDGFPRTIAQAEILDVILKEKRKQVDIAINLAVDDEEIVRRISNRFTCSRCKAIYNKLYAMPKHEGICDKCGNTEFIVRNDDKEEVVRVRLKVYKEQTAPIIAYYKEHGILAQVDGSKDSEEVFNVMKNIIDKIGH